MTRRILLVWPVFATIAVPAAADRREREKRPKTTEVEIVSANGHRAPDGIELDGRVRNASPRPLKGVTLIFSFYADEKKPLTTQSAAIDEAELAPGQEAVYRFAVREVPRAVSFTVQAHDGSERELAVSNQGPFTLE